MGTDVRIDTVEVPGASLHVETRGSGPILLTITGGPTDAGVFDDLAGRLADRYTVVAYDQRGHSRSPLEGARQDIPVALHADDAAAVLRSVTDEPAYVYGSSGGATIGLELLIRHPELVRRLVAHEPPLMQLLPDADRWRETFRQIDETYRDAGVFAAMGVFGAAVEQGGPSYTADMEAQGPPSPEAQEMMARMTGNFDLFIAHEIQLNGGHVPDLEALRDLSGKVVSAAGEDSEEQGARRAAIALAERLGVDATPLPGAHGGWGADPQMFADRLDEVLRGA
jgi:pimeloyl-ACP methyl ester carboxylesterase